jgi:hypothetical protein
MAARLSALRATIIWDVTPCTLVGRDYRRFTGTYCLHLQDQIVIQTSKQGASCWYVSLLAQISVRSRRCRPFFREVDKRKPDNTESHSRWLYFWIWSFFVFNFHFNPVVGKKLVAQKCSKISDLYKALLKRKICSSAVSKWKVRRVKNCGNWRRQR